MGDRFIMNKQCPRCGSIYETYDAPSSMMYIAGCKCGYDENLSYFETTNGHIYLIPNAVKKHIELLEKQIEDDEERMLM